MEDLAQEFLIENSFVNLGFLENKTGGITAGAYLLSITEIVIVFSKLRLALYLVLIITFWA